MEWSLTKAPHQGRLEYVEKQMGKTPSMLNDQPELFDHLAANWTAFCRLDHARNHSFGYPQPITIADIKAYADTHNLFGDDALELMNHVSILDREYMRISSEMHEKKRKKK